jgi:hypothetical protein
MSALSPSQADRPLHGLWSLWDVLQKYGLLFTNAVLGLAETKWLCAPFHDTAQGQKYELPIEAVKRVCAQSIHMTKQACILSDMDNVIPELDRLSDLIARKPPLPVAEHQHIAASLNHLIARIRDDLQSEFFFHVDQRDVSLYGQKELFGSKVSKKFAKAISDIESAGSCLALQQSTAAVFHLMRVMELGVQRFGTRLKVKINPRVESWAKIMDHVNKEINLLPGRTEAEKRKRARYSTAATYLDHVRLAWRNEVMHPKETYNREEAHDVFNAVKAFTSYLADLI